jgi:chaperonin cofactor prefoldin
VQKDVEGLEEAQNELILVDDDDAARYMFGACFVHTANDDADALITKGVVLLLKHRHAFLPVFPHQLAAVCLC